MTRATGTRTRSPLLAAACLAAAVVLLAGADTAAAATVTNGRGMPPWRIAQRFVQRPGLVRTERYPRNAGAGCVPSVAAATRIDYYLGVRVAWRGVGGRLRLIDVATSRAGDRSSDGFVVDSSRMGSVRNRHPGAPIAFGSGPLALGATSLTVLRRTGKEAFSTLVYWFDARGVLNALETFAGGC